MTVRRLEVAPPLQPGVHLRRPRGRLPFPLDEPRVGFFSRARHGLWHGLELLGMAPGDEVLAPAYHHGSEVEALTRAGLRCRFYEAQADLEPAADELEGLVGPRTRALHLIHPLGLPRDAPRWRRWCDERGLLLIEDAAQSWLGSVDGEPVGRFGDLAIFSLYKTVAVPDGGIAVPSPELRPDRTPRSGLRGVVGRHRSWARQHVGVPRRGPDRSERAPYSPERDFALGDPGSAASRATRYLLPRLADPATADRRRDNYRRLLAALGDRVPPPFGELPEGACPMAFPVSVRERHAAIDGLSRRGVQALDLWSVPHPSLPVERFPGAGRRRAEVIALPVHQGLAADALERIVDAAREHA